MVRYHELPYSSINLATRNFLDLARGFLSRDPSLFLGLQCRSRSTCYMYVYGVSEQTKQTGRRADGRDRDGLASAQQRPQNMP